MEKLKPYLMSKRDQAYKLMFFSRRKPSVVKIPTLYLQATMEPS